MNKLIPVVICLVAVVCMTGAVAAYDNTDNANLSFDKIISSGLSSNTSDAPIVGVYELTNVDALKQPEVVSRTITFNKDGTGVIEDKYYIHDTSSKIDSKLLTKKENFKWYRLVIARTMGNEIYGDTEFIVHHGGYNYECYNLKDGKVTCGNCIYEPTL